MCGIAGVVGFRSDRWAETYRILYHLMEGIAVRGRDATGIVCQTNPVRQSSRPRCVIAKEPVAPTIFARRNPVWKSLRHRQCSTVIMHARHWTSGEPTDNRNNHPHSAGPFHLIHNGVIHNFNSLAEQYGLPLETDCDSEILIKVVSQAKTVPIGLALCIREMSPGAIVVFDELHGICWMARDESRPLWIGRMRNDPRLWFASTAAILVDSVQDALQRPVAWELLIPLPSNYIFQLTAEGSIGAAYEEPIAPNMDWMDKLLPPR